LEMANSVVVLTLKPIAVPITLTVAPTDTLVIFPKDNVFRVVKVKFWNSLLLPTLNLKIHALLELALLRKPAAVLETANSVVALTLKPIAVPIMLTVAPTDTLVIFPRDNAFKEKRLSPLLPLQ